MKKVILVLLVLTMVVCIVNVEVFANMLSECHVCGVTGKCDKCHGEKMYACDRCNGSKKTDCSQCDDGFVTCHICNGQKTIACCSNPDCSNCHGTGKRDCGQCKATGSEQCPGCNGTQKCECNGCAGKGQVTCDSCNGNGICKSCKGTGYLSGTNNGVNNIPRKGDTVELSVTGNGKRIVWGASGGNTDGSTPAGPKNTPSSNNNKNVTGDDPQTVSATPEPTEPTEPQAQDYYIPENREEINIGDDDQPATAFFQMEEMEVAEQEELKAMPEEELKQILRDVDTIISSMKVGELSEKSEEVLTKVLENNKIQDKASVKLCKVNFEGHISLKFPVKVSVNIDSSYFTETDTIYAYHIADDGTVEFLGEAQRYTDNGKVTRIEFMTKGFSDFFVTTQKLVTETNPQTSENLPQSNHLWIYIASGAAVVLIAVGVIVLLKKRKSNENA